MLFEMYAEGAPGLRMWLCGDCGRVAYHRPSKPPKHDCEVRHG